MKYFVFLPLLLSLLSCHQTKRVPAQYEGGQRAYYELGDVILSHLTPPDFFDKYGDVWYLLDEDLDIADTDLGQLIDFDEYNRIKIKFMANGCTHQLKKKDGKIDKLCLIEDKERNRFQILGPLPLKKDGKSIPDILTVNMPKYLNGLGMKYYIKVNDCSKVRTISGRCW